jgi:PAS domain S-box-containing protein/putative nucleotidyltransferase with HDIG domain
MVAACGYRRRPIRRTVTGQGGKKAQTVTRQELVAELADMKRQVAGLRKAEKRQAETIEALRKNGGQYRDLVELAKSIIVRMDPAGNVTFVNEYARQFFGYGPDELTGRNVVGMIVPVYESSGRQLTELIAALCKSPDRLAVNENENVRKDGSRVWVLWSNKGVFNKKGELTAILSVGSDITARKQAEGVLKASNTRLGALVREKTARLREIIAQQKKEHRELQRSLAALRVAMDATIKALSATVEARDPYTAGHQQRVTRLAVAMAKEMRVDATLVEAVKLAGIVHDIGKICVPAEILTRPGKLSPNEFAVMKDHCQAGYHILKDIDFGPDVAEIVLQHHERLDGSGYPRALAGEAIHIAARIIAVADVVESMLSHRPYRPSLGAIPALREIRRNRDSLYDRTAVDACLRLFREKDFTFDR